jgi:hypothetical protein
LSLTPSLWVSGGEAAQISAGREALGWALRKLAAHSRLSEATIRNVERGALIKEANAFAIKRALVGASVTFDEDCASSLGTGWLDVLLGTFRNDLAKVFRQLLLIIGLRDEGDVPQLLGNMFPT